MAGLLKMLNLEESGKIFLKMEAHTKFSHAYQDRYWMKYFQLNDPF
jgi:hypothetical protein